MAPQNIKDDNSVAEFLKRRGYSPSKQEANDVPDLRVEDGNVENLGFEILRDFYHLPSDTKLELIVEGFDTE